MQFLSKQETVEIQRYIPLKRTVRKIISILVILTLPMIGYVTGSYFGWNKYKVVKHENRQLLVKSEDIKIQLRESKRVKNLAVTNVKIQKQAIERLRQDIISLQQQLKKQNTQLEMYRSIMESVPDKSLITFKNIKINQIKSQETETQPSYSFRAMVLQRSIDKDWFIGHLNVVIIGANSRGRLTEITHEQLFSNDRHYLKFKYFQVISRAFTLPVEFIPQAVRLTIKGNRSQSPVETVVKWEEVYEKILDLE